MPTTNIEERIESLQFRCVNCCTINLYYFVCATILLCIILSFSSTAPYAPYAPPAPSAPPAPPAPPASPTPPTAPITPPPTFPPAPHALPTPPAPPAPSPELLLHQWLVINL